MDRSWANARLFSKEHIDGVKEFMKFVNERFEENEEILCPCRRCLNRICRPQEHVEDHLYIHGMLTTYDKWIHHGEPFDLGDNESALSEQQHDGHPNWQENVVPDEDEDENSDDRIPEMVRELYTAADHDGRQAMFGKLIEELKRELYPGCTGYTRFSFVVKLLHIKSFYRISNVAFTALLTLLSLAFPNCFLPASYNEAKNLLCSIGLGYDSIHVCPNNCVLFRKEYAKLD